MRVAEAATVASDDKLDHRKAHSVLTHMVALMCLRDSTGVLARGVRLLEFRSFTSPVSFGNRSVQL